MKNKIIATTAFIITLIVLSIGASMAFAQNQPNTSVLEKVANALGVDPNKLRETIKQARQEHVNELLNNGQITEQQANRIRERINKDDENLGLGLGIGPNINRENKKWQISRGRERNEAILNDIASFLGISVEDLKNELKEKNIEEITREYNKDYTQLKNYLCSKEKERIDKLSQEGRLNSQQAENMKSRCETKIDHFLQKVGSCPMMR